MPYPFIQSLPVTAAFCDQLQPTDVDPLQRNNLQQRDVIFYLERFLGMETDPKEIPVLQTRARSFTETPRSESCK